MASSSTKSKNENRILKLSAKYYLVRDPYQMWIATKSKVKGKDTYRRVTGYYTDYGSLATGLFDSMIKEEDAQDLNELLMKAHEDLKEIKKYIRKMGKELENDH